MSANAKLFACLLAALFLLYGSYQAYVLWQDRVQSQRLATTADSLADLCLNGQKNLTKDAEIELLRSCVHTSTQHSLGAEFQANWRDNVKMAQAALAYKSGLRATKPEFECSTRSTLLAAVYKARGISSKSVTVIKSDARFSDHVILQVENPITAQLSLQDPSYDVSFEKENGRLAVIADFVSGAALPCRQDRCGWRLARADIGPVADLNDFSGAYIREKRKDDSVLLYDPQKFDRQAYCRVKAKWCRHPEAAR